MAEVALSDYIAYVFSEVSRARDMADRYSKEIAMAYAKDDVLRHFSVPRFKIAKMDLNMPVLVSGVQVSSLMKFTMDRQELRRVFLDAIVQIVKRMVARDVAVRTDGTEPILDGVHEQLTANPDPGRVDDVVTRGWNEVLRHVMKLNEVAGELLQRLATEIHRRALAEVIAKIKSGITTSRTLLDGLLVNPETNVVKNGSSDASVFTIKAELMEEGMFIRSVRDERTGAESRIVEFE